MALNSEQTAAALAVSNFVSNFWELMENGGNVAEHVTQDAVYDTRGQLKLEGREAFEKWGAKDGPKVVARHLLTNLQFLVDDWEPGRSVGVRGVMVFFGGVGDGVLPVALPMAIYDFTFAVVPSGDAWLMKEMIFDPVFVRRDEESAAYAGGAVEEV